LSLLGAGPNVRRVDPSAAIPLLAVDYRIGPVEVAVQLVRGQVRALLEQHGFRGDQVEAVLLGLDEVIMNACFHGGAAKLQQAIELRLALYDDRVVFEVLDRGTFTPRDGHQRAAAELPDDAAESGRGLFLIHATMDEVNFAPREGGGTSVRLVKRR
jgi:anti-sigma regulatory factor (Ser/Thr protein kinase)